MADRVLTVRLGADISAYQAAMRQASNTTLGVGTAGTTASSAVTQGFTRAAKVGAAMVTAAVGVGAAKVLQIGMAYEQQMQILQAVSQSSATKMQEVSARARQLGSDLEIPGTSAADAAEAMTELAKGGLSVDQAMAAAKGTLQLAAAAQIEGAQAAEIQSNALNAFGLKASDAAHVADVLANVANAASGEITDFASGMQQSSAVASSFGISLDDTATVLGLFANRGIQGSDAGTSFKTMLISMANPTAKAQAALEKLGVTVNDSEGNFVGARVITEQLSAARERMSQADFNAAAATAFGTDAMRAAVVMADGGVESFDAMAKAVGRNGGAADLSKAQMQGLSGAMGVMQSTTEDVALAFYDRFSPAIEAAVRTAAERLPRVADAIFDVLDKIGEFASAVGPTMSTGLSSAAGDLKTQATHLLLPLIDGARDLASKAAPYVIEFGEKVWDALMAVGDAIEPIVSAIGDLWTTMANNGAVDILGAMLGRIGSALQWLGEALRPVGEAIGWLVNLIGKIPGPVMAALVSFKAVTTLLPRLITLLIGVNSVAGPIALVVGAAAAAFALFSSSNQDAAQAVADHKAEVEALTATLNANTGAATANTDAQMRSTLESEGKLKILQDLGISMDQYLADVKDAAGAESATAQAMIQAGEAALYTTDSYQKLGSALDAANIGARDIAQAVATGDWSQVDATLTAYNDSLAANGSASEITINDLRNLGDELGGLNSVYGGYINQTKAFGDATASATRLLNSGSGSLGMFVSEGKMADNALSDVAGKIYGIGKNAGAVPAPVDKVTEAIQKVKSAAEEADTAAQGLMLTMDEMRGVAPDQEKQARLMASSIRDYGSAMRDIPAAKRDVKAAEDAVTQAQIDQRAALEELLKVQTNGEASADDITTATLKEQEARRSVKDALAAEAEAKRGVKDADDDLYESGQAVYENAIKVASAAGESAAALHGTAAGADAAQASMQKTRDEFVKTATNAGMAKGEAEKLATSIGLIPTATHTAFLANTDPALAAVSNLRLEIAKIQDKTVSIYVNQINRAGSAGSGQGYAPGIYTGGPVPGYAGGGLPGTPPADPTQDNLWGMSPSGLVRLRSREWIIQQPTADAIGARGMALFNSGALNGLVKAAAAGDIPAFAGGGVPSGGTLAGLAAAQPGDRLGRILDALEKLSEAVDRASESYRDARGEQKKTLEALNAVRADARSSRSSASAKVREETADLTRVTKEQAKKVADAQAAADKRVAEANARKSDDKGRAKAIADAEAARAIAMDKARTAQEKAIAAAEKQLAKAEAAQAKTIKASNQKIAAAEREYSASVKATKAARDLAVATAEQEKKQARNRAALKELGASYDRVSDKLDKARDKADGLRDDRAQVSSSIAGGISGHGGGITGASDLRLDAASIITGQKANLADMKKFDANIASLRKKGLDASLIEEIASAGIDGGGKTAAALAGASKSEIAQLNKLNAEINKTAKKTGDGVGDALFKAGIQAAEGIVKGLESKQSAVDKAMRKLGKSMAEGMKAALGIKSPSTVMRDQVGVQIVNGVIVGVESRTKALSDSMNSLVTIPSVNPADGVFSALSGPGGTFSPSSVNVSIGITGDGALAELFEKHAEIRVNGALVNVRRALQVKAGQS